MINYYQLISNSQSIAVNSSNILKFSNILLVFFFFLDYMLDLRRFLIAEEIIVNYCIVVFFVSCFIFDIKKKTASYSWVNLYRLHYKSLISVEDKIVFFG